MLAVATTAAVCVPVAAQPDQGLPAPQPRHVRNAAQRPMPFSPGSETTKPVDALEFRPYEQMSQQDRDLAANAQSLIGEHAGFAGVDFPEGKWSSQQIVCPALPNHLLLQFMRNNGEGDVSAFSASIPHAGTDGRVRIIPILRRGYSLFSPSPINALTLSVFNQIRAEEHSTQTPTWLETGLCYGALAGAHPQMAPEETAVNKLPAAPPGRLDIPMHGGAVISFTDASAIPRPMLWTMTFDGKGRLLKATHSPVPRSKEKAVERKPVDIMGKTVKANDPDAKAILIR